MLLVLLLRDRPTFGLLDNPRAEARFALHGTTRNLSDQWALTVRKVLDGEDIRKFDVVLPVQVSGLLVDDFGGEGLARPRFADAEDVRTGVLLQEVAGFQQDHLLRDEVDSVRLAVQFDNLVVLYRRRGRPQHRLQVNKLDGLGVPQGVLLLLLLVHPTGNLHQFPADWTLLPHEPLPRLDRNTDVAAGLQQSPELLLVAQNPSSPARGPEVRGAALALRVGYVVGGEASDAASPTLVLEVEILAHVKEDEGLVPSYSGDIRLFLNTANSVPDMPQPLTQGLLRDRPRQVVALHLHRGGVGRWRLAGRARH